MASALQVLAPDRRAAFAHDVRRDLALRPRQIQSKYLYDALGSCLFELFVRFGERDREDALGAIACLVEERLDRDEPLLGALAELLLETSPLQLPGADFASRQCPQPDPASPGSKPLPPEAIHATTRSAKRAENFLQSKESATAADPN